MPFIQTKTNKTITAEQEKQIKERLGKAASIIGKSESWLMLGFEDNCRMYFKGDNSKPMAFVEVKLYGSAPKSAYEKMTAEICTIFGDVLGISADCVYVKYEEVENWGWNGGNF